MLTSALANAGFDAVAGNGAFYLLMAAPDGDEQLLLDRLAAKRIVAVGGSDFGAPGYVRLSYCLPSEAVSRALPLFAQVAKEYRLSAQPALAIPEPAAAPAQPAPFTVLFAS